MRFLRSAILAVGMMGLCAGMAACGGSQGAAEESTTPAANPCAGGDATAPANPCGTEANPCGGDMANPCAGGDMANPCAGGDEAANPCAGGENPCGGDL